MRNFLEVSTVCGRAANRSARSAVATTPSVAIAPVKKLRRSDTAISHLQGFSTGISDLDLSLVHRMLLPLGTQRVCRQSSPSENRIVTDGQNLINRNIGMWESALLGRKKPVSEK